MNWKELKEVVDSHVKTLGIDDEMVEIDWIDINWCNADDLEVSVTIGSDDRIEMTISS